MTDVNTTGPADNRLVYSAHGTWWDHISKVATRNGLPVCPHCGSVLFEMDGESEWWAGAERYEAAGHPGYVAMIAWGRGKCFPSLAAQEPAYKAAGSPPRETMEASDGR